MKTHKLCAKILAIQTMQPEVYIKKRRIGGVFSLYVL